MENVNDREIDLGLALGITNQRVELLSNTGAGANANSRSRVDTMTFVGPHPVTELVWSTENGISIKCAGGSSCFADKNPCMLRDVGPSQMGVSPSQDTKDEKRAIEGHSVGSRTTCHVGSAKSPRSVTPGPFLGSSLGHTDENVGEVKCVHFKEMGNCNTGKEKECITSSKSIPVGNVAGTSEGPQNQRTADLLPLLANEPEILEGKTENFGNGTDRLGLNIGLPLKFQGMTQYARQERLVPDLPSVIAHVVRGEYNLKEDGSSGSPFLEKIEETAENDVQDLIVKDAILENQEIDRRGNLVPGEDSSSDSRMRGQNREASCQEGNERDEDDSHGSMESCNSANLSSKRNKRWSFEEQLIIGSKRIKKQTQECPFSMPVVKQDSSFMNWISNMVKGIKPYQEEGHALALSVGHPIDDDQKIGVCDKTLNFGSKRLGFQTVFQSLYSQNAKPLETRTQIENKSVHGSKEIILFDKIVSDHGPDDSLNRNASGNLRITRLYPKTPSTLFSSNNSDLKSFVAKDSYTDDASASVGFKQFWKNKFKKSVALTPSETLKTPDEMDVLKYTRPTVTRDSTTHSKTTCFFCGKMGHGLRDCLQINEKELEAFLQNISLYEGITKDAPFLCIKCFQLNHWASACPSKRCYSMIKTKTSWSGLNFKLKENGNVFFKQKVANLNEIPTQLASSSGKNKSLNEEKILGIPKELIDTIRRLRLSRTDILKWMNSRLLIANLAGYFLRLRIEKWEEGVGGAGYYVACITGSQEENPSKRSKKLICVSVGGVECLVESRYISNCDFLEDELIAWWQKMLTSKHVPMEEDFTSKLEERKKLGF